MPWLKRKLTPGKTTIRSWRKQLADRKAVNTKAANTAAKIRYQANKEAIKLARSLGIGIAEARSHLAPLAAARPAPIALDRKTEG